MSINPSYLPINTNGTPGTVVVTDPKYGAYGDGVHDDTAAIQAAVNSGASSVYVPPGQYIVSAVTLPANLTLRGNGPSSVILASSTTANTITLADGNTLEDLAFSTLSGVAPTNQWFVYGTSANQITGRKLQFTLNQNGGFTVQAGNRLVLDQVAFSGTTQQAGIYGVGIDMFTVSHVHAYQVTFSANRPAIIRFSNSARGSISASVIRDISGLATMTQGAQGVDLYGSNDISVTGVISSHATSVAGSIDGFTTENAATNIAFTGCVANSNSGDGFDIYNSSVVTLSSCQGLNNAGNGAESYTSTDTSYDNCTFNGNGSNGLQFVGSTVGSAANVHASNNKSVGILVAAQGSATPAQIVLDHCTTLNNNQAGSTANYMNCGISLQSGGADVAVSHCISRNTGAGTTQGYGIVVVNSGWTNVQISNNQTDGNAVAGIGNMAAGDIRLIRSSALASLAGATAGTISFDQTEQTQSKTFRAVASGYENSGTTNQTITFPYPYTYSPTISTNTTGLTLTVSTTALTITAPNSTTTYSGVIVVEGI